MVLLKYTKHIWLKRNVKQPTCFDAIFAASPPFWLSSCFSLYSSSSLPKTKTKKHLRLIIQSKSIKITLNWTRFVNKEIQRICSCGKSLLLNLTFPSQPVWVWSDTRAARSPGWCASPRCCSSVFSWRCATRWVCHLRNSSFALLPGYKLQIK